MRANLAAALKKSLNPKSVTDRASRADAYLSATKAPPIAHNAPASGPLVTRDTFSFPAEEHARIDALRQRLLDAGLVAGKSEIMRLGLAQLDALAPTKLASAFKSLKKLKPGRKKG